MRYEVTDDTGLKLIVTDRNDLDIEVTPIMGGDDSNPTWAEYTSDIKDEYKPQFELIKRAITELGWIGETAENIANYWCFLFPDTGDGWSFSWRAWGDLMQAIVDKKEGYMTYYM